jgi:hypothetical protein
MEMLTWLATRRPLIAHNIGLSLGSSDVFDREYIAQLAKWQERFHFRWHSDHLSFSQVTGHGGQAYNVGVALPVPYDEEALEMMVERIMTVQDAIGVPFLIENNVYYAPIPDEDMQETEFLNRLAQRSGCGLLLDVHNVYTNARNHGFSAGAFIDALDLDYVQEVHVAGGNELAGMYMDSHAGRCPQDVWDLLHHVASSASNLRAVTFEFHDSYFPGMGHEGVMEQIGRARDVWATAIAKT